MNQHTIIGLLALVSPASVQAAQDSITMAEWARTADVTGMWHHSTNWEVEQSNSKKGDETICSVTTDPQNAYGETYRFSMTFGAVNEIALTTNIALKKPENASLELEDGGGLDMMDLRLSRSGSSNTVSNSVSPSMFKKVLDQMRTSGTGYFVMNGRQYKLPMEDFNIAFEDMRKCEKRRLGIIIDD